MGTQSGPKTNRELALAHQSSLLSSELKKKGWSMSDLSRECGVPLYTISRALNGHTLLKAEAARQIGAALGIKIRHLLQADRRAAPHEIPEGIHTETLDNGTIRVLVNARVQPGVEMALSALVNYDSPISTERLWMILDALYASPRSAAQEFK